MPIIKLDKAGDALLCLIGPHLTNPKYLQIMMYDRRKHWCIEVKKIYSLLIESNPCWARKDVNAWISFAASISWWPEPGDAVVRAALVAKFQSSRILIKWFGWKIQLLSFPPLPRTASLIWFGRAGEKGENDEGNQRKADGRDWETALHPRHLNKQSSVLHFQLFFFLF